EGHRGGSEGQQASKEGGDAHQRTSRSRSFEAIWVARLGTLERSSLRRRVASLVNWASASESFLSVSTRTDSSRLRSSFCPSFCRRSRSAEAWARTWAISRSKEAPAFLAS